MDKLIIKMPDYLATRYQAEQLSQDMPDGEIILDWSETKFIGTSAYDGLQQALGRRFTHINLEAHLVDNIADIERLIAERDAKIERGEI